MASMLEDALSRLSISPAAVRLVTNEGGSQTCKSCNALFVSASSRVSILNAAPFKYTRKLKDLEAAASSGCILCKQILDRHMQLGPKNTSDSNCPPACPWFSYSRDDSQPTFLIHSMQDERYRDYKLRYVKVRGMRRASLRHLTREEAHVWQLVYEVTSDDALLRSEVPTWPPAQDVASSQSTQLARKWLRDCIDNHEECQLTIYPVLPSRVINVSQSEINPKLHVSGPNERAHYIALSYCWGGPQTSKTTRANLETYKTSLDLESQPQTLKDAIRITRELGIRYLWVDSICIVQDDEQDMLRELSQMRLTYRHALLTISAASAAACTEGFLNAREKPRFPVKLYTSEPTFESITLQYHNQNGKIGLIQLTPSILSHLDAVEDPIFSRAWTLQESLLSTRLLMYGKTQLLWRCTTSFEKDGGHLPWACYAERAPVLGLSDEIPIDRDKEVSRLLMPGTTAILFGDDMFVTPPYDEPQDEADPGGLTLSKAEKEWLRIVTMYSRRHVTVPSDILPAIGGIAEEIQRVIGGTYCAGLWLDRFIVGLAWRRAREGTGRAQPWRAPTWSWASTEGGVDYDLTQHHWSFMLPAATVKDVSLTRDPSTTRYGKLISAWVTVEGSLIPLSIEPIHEAKSLEGGGTRMTVLQFADVYIMGDAGLHFDDTGAVYETFKRRGTAILDEPITSLPLEFRAPDGGSRVYALQLFGSRRWPGPPRRDGSQRYRSHGLLLVKLNDGTFMRVGWYNTFAMTMDELPEWREKEEWRVVKIV